MSIVWFKVYCFFEKGESVKEEDICESKFYLEEQFV